MLDLAASLPAFLSGGGVMGERMRALDWSATILGAPDGWPEPLTTLVGVMLNSRQPMFIAWGPDRILLYNDGYAPMLGAKDAGALARPFFDVWPEVRKEVGALMDGVFAGDPVFMDDLQLTLYRNGYPEECHFAFSYTPVLGRDGKVDGLFSPCIETTRQVIAERTLERTKVRSRTWEVSSDLIGVANAEGMFERTNPAWGVTLGWSEAEMAGASYLDFVHPDDVEATLAAFARLEAGEPVLHLENRYRTKKGGYRWLAWIAVPEDRLYYCSARDVTEAKEQAASLAARTAERDRIWNVSRDLLLVADHDGTWLSVNPSWTERLGWTEGELVGRTSEWLEHPDDQAKTRAEIGKLAEGKVTFAFENRFRTRDGDYRHLSWTAVLADDLIYASARDVTDERAGAAQLAERTAERDQMWETSPDLMLIIDFDGVFRRVNPAWTAVLGYSSDELVGHHVNDFVLTDDHAGTIGAYTEAAEGGSPRLVNRYRHKDGSVRWISWVAAPRGDITYATGRDITAEKDREEALARAEEALRQSQKMEAVGQLTGGLAHDFNNILAGISGSLEMAQTRIQQGRLADVDRYMVAAQGAAKRAAALTHRLLAFSRRQTLEPKPTDVNRLVGGMEDLVRRTVGPAITVETVAKAGLWPTLVDPNQLENALLNLCINARDAMPDGGKLVIETGNRWLDERGAKERDLPPGQYISMCVSDNGSGMPKDVIEKAFEPFFTTKPIGVGTGLGLSMIYGFARQSGGQVRIYSEVGRGTMVCIYLPRHHGAEDAVEVAAASTVSSQAEVGETVLVIDDEPLVRMLVVDVLEDLGYRALEAGDGPQGMRIVQSAERIDLLITDVGLPNGMNGRQVADAARQYRPDLKVLFVTGYAENAVLSHGHLDPGMHVVTKPFMMEALAAKIRLIIGKQ